MDLANDLRLARLSGICLGSPVVDELDGSPGALLDVWLKSLACAPAYKPIVVDSDSHLRRAAGLGSGLLQVGRFRFDLLACFRRFGVLIGNLVGQGQDIGLLVQRCQIQL